MTTPTATMSSTTSDWAPLRAVLEAQRTEHAGQRSLALAETVTSVPDAVALRRAATLLCTIEEIDAALDRMDTGTYGGCVQCGSAIAPERLEFRPFAPRCVSCEQAR